MVVDPTHRSIAAAGRAERRAPRARRCGRADFGSRATRSMRSPPRRRNMRRRRLRSSAWSSRRTRGCIAQAVHATSPSLAAELAGSRIAVGDGRAVDAARLLVQHADRSRASPRRRSTVLRNGAPFTDGERLLAQLAAGELALVLAGAAPRRARPTRRPSGARPRRRRARRRRATTRHRRARRPTRRGGVGRARRSCSGAPTATSLARGVRGESPAAESAALSAARVVLDSRDVPHPATGSAARRS